MLTPGGGEKNKTRETRGAERASARPGQKTRPDQTRPAQLSPAHTRALQTNNRTTSCQSLSPSPCPSRTDRRPRQPGRRAESCSRWPQTTRSIFRHLLGLESFASNLLPTTRVTHHIPGQERIGFLSAGWESHVTSPSLPPLSSVCRSASGAHSLKSFLVFSFLPGPRPKATAPTFFSCMLLRVLNQVLGSLMDPLQNEITSNRTKSDRCNAAPSQQLDPHKGRLGSVLFAASPLPPPPPLPPLLHHGCSDAAHPVSSRGGRGGWGSDGEWETASSHGLDPRPGLHACSCYCSVALSQRLGLRANSMPSRKRRLVSPVAKRKEAGGGGSVDELASRCRSLRLCGSKREQGVVGRSLTQ